MDKDRARQGQPLHAVKRVVGKQNALFLADTEVPQAMTAWAMAAGNFNMRRMPVSRRLQGGTHDFCRLGWNRYYANGIHFCSPPGFSLLFRSVDFPELHETQFRSVWHLTAIRILRSNSAQ